MNQNEKEININQINFIELEEPEELEMADNTFEMNGHLYDINKEDDQNLYCREYEIINEVVHRRDGFMTRYFRQFKFSKTTVRFNKEWLKRQHKSLIEYDQNNFIFFIELDGSLYYQKQFENAQKFFNL